MHIDTPKRAITGGAETVVLFGGGALKPASPLT